MSIISRDFTLWKTHNRKCMSTALVYCGTSEGFVIGADGRAFNELTQHVESDTERKIFTFESPVASVVFAWVGLVKFQIPGLVFSLVETTQDLLAQADFSRYFAQDMNDKLQLYLRQLRTYDSGECARGIFLSYRRNQPWVSQIKVFRNGRTLDCSIEEGIPNGEIDLFSGPPKIFEKPRSLDDAADSIGVYLDECVANPTNTIGGHVHIGKFTREGFSWIKPPKQ